MQQGTHAAVHSSMQTERRKPVSRNSACDKSREIGGVKIHRLNEIGHLGSLAPDAASQLNILGHNGDPLGMDCAKIGVFKETHQISFSCLLQSQDSRALEAQIRLEVLGDLTHKALEGQLADEKLCALLILADLAQSNGARPEAMGLLHTTGSWGRLAGSLGGQLLARGLASCGLAGSLLGTRHSSQTMRVTEDSMLSNESENEHNFKNLLHSPL
ncbi:hypothetical protein L7F22_009443 [Adiantum nelumboides]|nr:hypothetical protein [Adiantum nelumboides]